MLGYCVFPINLGALIVAFVGYFPIKLVLVLACFGWSTYGIINLYFKASIGFMGALVLEERKLLAVYPVFLFYLFLAWFAIRVWKINFIFKINIILSIFFCYFVLKKFNIVLMVLEMFYRRSLVL